IPTIDTTMGLLVLDPRPRYVDCLIKSLQHGKIDTIITTPCEPLYFPPGGYSLVLSREKYQTWQDTIQIAQNQVTIVKKDLNRLRNTLKIKLKITDLSLITTVDSVDLKLQSEDTLVQRINKINKNSSEYHLKFENVPYGNYIIFLNHPFYKLVDEEIKHDSLKVEHVVELKAKRKTINLVIEPIAPYNFKLDDSLEVHPEITPGGCYELEDVPFGKHKITMIRSIGDSIVKDEWEIVVNDSGSPNYYRHFRPRFHFNHFSVGQTWTAFPPVMDRFQTHILFKTDIIFLISRTSPKYILNAYMQFKNSTDFYIRSPIQLADSNKTVSSNGYCFGVKHDLISSKNWVLAGSFEYDNNLKCTEDKYSQNLNCIDLKILYSQKSGNKHFIDLNLGVSRYYGQDDVTHSIVHGDILTMSMARRLVVSSSFWYSFDISGAFRLDSAKKRWDGALAVSIDYRLSPSQLISLQCSTSSGISRLLRIYYPHQFSRTVIALSLLTLVE
ncbi:MAG: PEGA domain-containing protein, partial [bacterium]